LGKRTFPDVIAIGSTDFDQHGLQSSAFARLGYLPYHRDIKEIRIPLRACIPKGIDNLLITGKAFSAERDAFSFMRMQPDMQNMGYAVGLAAAMALQRSGSVRDVDWAELKASLFSKGILRRQDIEPPEPEKPLAALVGAADEPEAFLQLLCQPKERILPLLKTCYGKEDYRRVSLPIAMALAWFGANDGVDEIISCLERLRHEEQHDTIDRAGRPVGGFIEKPDTYWKVNQLITVLGMSGDPKALPVLRELVRETDAGGPPRHHAKLHWRRIPNYDRIVCLCHSLDLLATGEPLDELEALIDKPYIGGHVSRGQSDAEGKYASSLLELMIARTLAKTGSKKGLSVLIEYLDDVQTVLSDHAYSELKRITGKDFGKSSEAWTRGLFHEKAEKYIVSYD
jgi:hypothetical protein